jgi:hypothetical protein
MGRPKKKKPYGSKSPPGKQTLDTAPTQPKLPENKFPVVVKTRGRPSDYNTYVTGIICGRITEGESLRKICRDEEMPAISTVFTWLMQHKEFAEQYARAVENRVETHVEEIYDIADDATNDYAVDADGNRVVDHEHIQRSKLRVDVRKWAASKMKPKKYGEITTQKHTGPRGDEPVQIAAVTIKAEDMEPDARDMLRQALLLARPAQTETEEGDDDE